MTKIEKIYLNTKELSQYLGRSEKAIRSLAFRKQVPFRKPGGRLIFLKNEIDRWVESSGGLSLEHLEQSVK